MESKWVCSVLSSSEPSCPEVEPGSTRKRFFGGTTDQSSAGGVRQTRNATGKKNKPDLSGRKKPLYIPAALDLERPKRPRTTFTDNQLEMLEREFERNHFIGEAKRQKLATELELTETQIKVWFQNRRTKSRRLGECQGSPTGHAHVGSSFTNARMNGMTTEKYMLPTTSTAALPVLLPPPPPPFLESSPWPFLQPALHSSTSVLLQPSWSTHLGEPGQASVLWAKSTT